MFLPRDPVGLPLFLVEEVELPKEEEEEDELEVEHIEVDALLQVGEVDKLFALSTASTSLASFTM